MKNTNLLLDELFNNPYRIIGIYGGATEKEIHSKKGKIEAYCRVGKAVKMGTDFPFLPSIERSEQKIFEADKSISHNEGRFFNSLFWFTKINNTDDEAIKSLEVGDYEIAQRIWEEAIDNDDESHEALSWYSNLGTFKLMMAAINKDEGLLAEGLEDKLRLLNDY